jgi:hypothetical protein
MKKLVSMSLVAFLLSVAVSWSVERLAQPEPELTEAQVNARIDARLKQVLAGMILNQAASRTTVAGR